MSDLLIFAGGAAVCLGAALLNRLRPTPPTTPPASPHAVLRVSDYAHVGSYPHPLLSRVYPPNTSFSGPEEVVVTSHREGGLGEAIAPSTWLVAGPRTSLAFDPSAVRVAIATTGSICPGVNTVLRELVMALSYLFGVPRGHIVGVQHGLRGFLPGAPAPIHLNPDVVSRWHTLGGSQLGTSRAGVDTAALLAAIAHKYDIVYLVGGDGTHRAAAELSVAIAAAHLPLAIVCIPSSAEGDFPIVDRVGLGVATTVAEACAALTCAHAEAISAKGGIGLVKLPGRSSGWLTAAATLAQRDVNVAIFPENCPWSVDLLCAHLARRLGVKSHALISLAEGAMCEEQAAAIAAGGGRVETDVGVWTRDRISSYFKAKGGVANLKYVDCSATLCRAVPANASDSVQAMVLAFDAAHAGLAGFSGVSVTQVGGEPVLLPAGLLGHTPPARLGQGTRLWARVLASTGQPDFTPKW